MLTLGSFLLIIFSVLGGGGNKYADLLNEHGLKHPFRYASLFYGLLWGGATSFLVYYNPYVCILYLATTLYWFLKLKLEYTNHALAGILIICTSIYFYGDFLKKEFDLFFLIFALFTVTGYLQTYLKNKNIGSWWFWRMRLRIYLIPLALSIIVDDYTPFLVTIISMIANEMVRYYYFNYENDQSLLKDREAS